LTGLLGQIEAFVLTLVLGLLTGTIFHFYQELIRAARVSRYILYFLDFSLWIIIIALVFLGMLFINQGEMRIYVLIALVLGILIYYRRFASRLDAPISRLAGATVTICSTFVKGIKKALSWLKKMIANLKPRPKDPPADSED
jgi:spore cortex biosynthesis protein YabQ